MIELTDSPPLQVCDRAFDKQSTDICIKIRDLLHEELGLDMKDHGLWRIQCLIYDELKEKAEIQKKSLTNN
tara:strand:+ start:244 stop:456 length:213 start_codon:yes stop_codon:yes gene_type:complete